MPEPWHVTIRSPKQPRAFTENAPAKQAASIFLKIEAACPGSPRLLLGLLQEFRQPRDHVRQITLNDKEERPAVQSVDL